MRELNVEALPTAIPEAIVHDVSGDADRRDVNAGRGGGPGGGRGCWMTWRRRCWRRCPRRGCKARRATEIEAETELVGDAEKAAGGSEEWASGEG